MDVIRAQESEARRGERFTGTAWVEALLKAQRPGGMRVYRVFFEPRARTHWHAHDGEQTLYVVEGRGRVGKSGGRGWRRSRTRSTRRPDRCPPHCTRITILPRARPDSLYSWACRISSKE